MAERQTNIDADLFTRVMALPTSLRHDVLKFIGATHAGTPSQTSLNAETRPGTTDLTSGGRQS